MNYFGDIRGENADISNDKRSEKLLRRKSKVSYSMLIKIGLVDSKVRLWRNR